MARYIIAYVRVCVCDCVCVSLYVNPTPAPHITSTWNFFAVNCKVLFFVFAFVLFYFSILILFSPLRPFKFFLIGIVKLMIAVCTMSFPPPKIYNTHDIDVWNTTSIINFPVFCFVCFSHFQIRFYYYFSFSFTTQCGLVRIICNFYKGGRKRLVRVLLKTLYWKTFFIMFSS